MWELFFSTPTGLAILKIISKHEIEDLMTHRHMCIKQYECLNCDPDFAKTFNVEKFKIDFNENSKRINSLIHLFNKAFPPEFLNQMMIHMQHCLSPDLRALVTHRRPLTWFFDTDSNGLIGILIWISLFCANKAPLNWSRLLAKLTVRGDTASDPIVFHEKRIDRIKIMQDSYGTGWSVGLDNVTGRRGVRSFMTAELHLPIDKINDFSKSRASILGPVFLSEETTLFHELVHIKHHTKGHYIGEKSHVLDVEDSPALEPESDLDVPAATPEEGDFALTRGGPRFVEITRSRAFQKLRNQEIRRGYAFTDKRRAKMARAIEASFGDFEAGIETPRGGWNPEEYMTVQFGKLTENSFREELGMKKRTTYSGS